MNSAQIWRELIIEKNIKMKIRAGNQMILNYNEIGLKAGIEIHQQLDTQHKLFCSCPTAIRDDKADVVVKRRLRASAGVSDLCL